MFLFFFIYGILTVLMWIVVCWVRFFVLDPFNVLKRWNHQIIHFRTPTHQCHKFEWTSDTIFERNTIHFDFVAYENQITQLCTFNNVISSLFCCNVYGNCSKLQFFAILSCIGDTYIYTQCADGLISLISTKR